MIYKDKDGKLYKVNEGGIFRATKKIEVGDILVIRGDEFITISTLYHEQALLPFVEEKRVGVCLEPTDLTEEEAKLINAL